MNQQKRNEAGLRILEDVADLLKVRDELTREIEAHRNTHAELKLHRDRADRYQGENAALSAQCDYLTQQNAEFRAQLEAYAQNCEDEVESLKQRRSKHAAAIRKSIAKAEMAPYADAPRPLARLEMN